MLFNIYICPKIQLVQKFGLSFHQYADDNQLYLLKDSQPYSTPDTLSKALEEVAN